jgi:hypothetical protein
MAAFLCVAIPAVLLVGAAELVGLNVEPIFAMCLKPSVLIWGVWAVGRAVEFLRDSAAFDDR